jgi:hypothetical protein
MLYTSFGYMNLAIINTEDITAMCEAMAHMCGVCLERG